MMSPYFSNLKLISSWWSPSTSNKHPAGCHSWKKDEVILLILQKSCTRSIIGYLQLLTWCRISKKKTSTRALNQSSPLRLEKFDWQQTSCELNLTPKSPQVTQRFIGGAGSGWMMLSDTGWLTNRVPLTSATGSSHRLVQGQVQTEV